MTLYSTLVERSKAATGAHCGRANICTWIRLKCVRFSACKSRHVLASMARTWPTSSQHCRDESRSSLLESSLAWCQ